MGTETAHAHEATTAVNAHPPSRRRSELVLPRTPADTNAPSPVHHPPAARVGPCHIYLRPRVHLRAPYEPVHADPLSARTPTASTPTPHASLLVRRQPFIGPVGRGCRIYTLTSNSTRVQTVSYVRASRAYCSRVHAYYSAARHNHTRSVARALAPRRCSSPPSSAAARLSAHEAPTSNPG